MQLLAPCRNQAISVSLQPVIFHVGKSWAKLPLSHQYPTLSAEQGWVSCCSFSAGNLELESTLYSCLVQTRILPWEKTCPWMKWNTLMKRDGRLKGESEQFLSKDMDLVPQSTSVICPHVKNPEETGDDCPVTVRGTQTSLPTPSHLFPPGRGSFHQACKKLYIPYQCAVWALSSTALHSFVSQMAEAGASIRSGTDLGKMFIPSGGIHCSKASWPGLAQQPSLTPLLQCRLA